MLPFAKTQETRRFQRDENGSVAVIFGLVSVAVVMFCGVAIDLGRASHSNTRLSQALDAAALAAAKGIRLEGLSDDQAKVLATHVFNENMAKTSGRWTNLKSPLNVNLDRATWTAQVDIDAAVPTAFAGIVGVKELPLHKSAVAIFDIKDIEVSVQLDLTGSMCNPCSKIAALRSASADLIDILLPDSGTTNKVRVALAPFSQTVNAGALAKAVSHNTSTGCVYESNAVDPNTDAAPNAVNYLKNAGACPVSGSGTKLPAVVPLTSDKQVLKNEVANYETYSYTAGQLGTSWAWYTLSPNWASVMPSASKPVTYNDGKTAKIAILMTDGVYNTVNGVGDGSNVGPLSTDSQNRAKAMCDNMKKAGITIYTVGFDIAQISNTIAEANAIKTLTHCASSADKFYQATNSAELTGAFHSIANHIMSLRVSQ